MKQRKKEEIPTILFMSLLGIPDTNLGRYTVRLDEYLDVYMDVLDAYYNDRQALFGHYFTRKWKWDNKAKGNINTE